ncbi:hypothetical protein HanOQP8_Chr09g0346671 [Helianthus annuus]|nr:hypothetical protein HanLR1_Chr09g0342591 [Helianthus annuus]KAJ0713513.1 hypothetical protein HanOQP8_Chr09g0346671 [Helianthus annuus]
MRAKKKKKKKKNYMHNIKIEEQTLRNSSLRPATLSTIKPIFRN